MSDKFLPTQTVLYVSFMHMPYQCQGDTKLNENTVQDLHPN